MTNERSWEEKVESIKQLSTALKDYRYTLNQKLEAILKADYMGIFDYCQHCKEQNTDPENTHYLCPECERNLLYEVAIIEKIARKHGWSEEVNCLPWDWLDTLIDNLKSKQEI